MEKYPESQRSSTQSTENRQEAAWVMPCLQKQLFNDEELHVHHRKPKAQGGKDTYGNLVLVHAFCHQQIHAREGGENELVKKGRSCGA